MRRLLLSLILLLVPTLAGAQGNRNTLPPACTATTLLTTCVPQVAGVRARVVDADSAAVCTNSGAGATLVVCEYNGSAWVVTAPSGSPAGTWTGANDETLTNTPDGTFLFSRDDAGVVTITAADNDAVAALNILAGGAAAMTIGGASTTNITLTSDVGVTFGNNSDQINNLVDATFTLVRNDAGVVTLTAADDDATAALTILAGGAAALTLGGSTGTAIVLDTEGLDFNLDGLNPSTGSLVNSATGSVVLDFRDYADTTDDDMAHGSIAVNCTDTGSGTEDCDVQINATKAGNGETRILLNGDTQNYFNGGDITLRSSDAAGEVWDTTGSYVYGQNRYASSDVELETNRFIGIPGVVQDLKTGADNTDSFFLLPAAATCAPIGGGTEANDTADFRHEPNVSPASSYEMTFDSSVGAAEGVDCNVTGATTTGYTRVGFWLKSTVAFASGDLEVVLDDGASAEATENLEAYVIPNRWQYFNTAVTADCAATCSDIDGIFIQTTAQAPSTFNDAVINVDELVVYKGAAELALDAPEGSYPLLDGVVSVIGFPTAGGAPVQYLEDIAWIQSGYAGAGMYPVLLTDTSGYTLLWTFAYYPWQYDQ